MLLRVVLLLSAALLIGIAIGIVMQDGDLAFWLMAVAGFLGSWGLCPLSSPLLERHQKFARDLDHS